MSTVLSSGSPDPTGWQSVRGRVNVIGGNNDEDCQFRRHGRRGDSLPSFLESAPGQPPHSKGLNDLSWDSPPKFPKTPAEFHLFPSACSTRNARHPQYTDMERQGERLGVSHLTTLRSAAFWELHRSVIENGEGLIRRMRDYEQSRLHQQIRLKAKERKKRSHKSSTLRSRCKARSNVSEASDDDHVLICSEVTSNGLSHWPSLAARARSLDPMDVDREDQDRPGRRDARSMPGADYSRDHLPYDDGIPVTDSLGIEEDSESLLSYTESASPTPSSSSISLPLPQPLSTTDDGLLVPSTSSTEKALADLNFAFANGACSITDYSPIWTYQQQINTDEHDSIRHGDLWR